MDHSQFLVNRSLNDENEINGHALMATVPPISHVEHHGMDVPWEQKMPSLQMPSLSRMLNLCAALPGITNEVTPVMAWAAILSHPKCEEMSKEDFGRIKDDLKPKVRCYGFGAVLEDFEIKDAIMGVLSQKAQGYNPGIAMDWTAPEESS